MERNDEWKEHTIDKVTEIGDLFFLDGKKILNDSFKLIQKELLKNKEIQKNKQLTKSANMEEVRQEVATLMELPLYKAMNKDAAIEQAFLVAVENVTQRYR